MSRRPRNANHQARRLRWCWSLSTNECWFELTCSTEYLDTDFYDSLTDFFPLWRVCRQVYCEQAQSEYMSGYSTILPIHTWTWGQHCGRSNSVQKHTHTLLVLIRAVRLRSRLVRGTFPETLQCITHTIILISQLYVCRPTRGEQQSQTKSAVQHTHLQADRANPCRTQSKAGWFGSLCLCSWCGVFCVVLVKSGSK